MDSQNSYYPYSENFIFHQTNSPRVNYFLPAQTISSEPYYSSVHNRQSGQIGKEDKRSSYTNSNEYAYYTNHEQKDEKISSYKITNESVYWKDKLARTNNLTEPKFQESNLIFQGPFDGIKSKNYQNRKGYNHYNSPDFNYTPCAENRSGEKTLFFEEATFNKYNDTVEDNRFQSHKKCIFGSSYCVNTNSCIVDETTIIKDLREEKGEVPKSSNYSEYCEDYSGFGNYFGLTSTSNISELDITDPQTEDSNGGSDIIVEESEDENYTIVQNTKQTCNRCVVCNSVLVPQGVQFYYVTSNSPVTMTSQRPVFFLLKSLIKNIQTKDTYICCECLVLLNTIDHFQFQLDNYKSEFRYKLQRTTGRIGSEISMKRRKLKQSKTLSSYQCKYCKKTLYFRNYCQYHLMKHKNCILCEKCGILCKSGKMFYRHNCIYSKISKTSVMQALSCSNCNKCFTTKFQLKEHQNSCLGILPYICKIPNCGKRFATFTRMKNHGKLKHDKKFIAICSICNIGFIKISDYKSHKVIHSNDKKFQCQKCGRSYKTISNLNFHLKSHQQSLPYSCSICRKGFMRKEYLETHINNHKGIKNFICTICSKKFASQKNLDSHFKYHDGSIQKQICNICGKSLTTSMNEHLRIHTNLREYECNHCDLKFNTKGTLRKHQKSKHKESCSNKFISVQ